MPLNVPVSKLGVIETVEMESVMSLYDETLHELRRKEILEEIKTLRLQREAVRGKTLYDKCLALMGRGMIFLGNKLCQRHQNLVNDSFLAACQKS
jgi:hypothetical protein